MATSVTGSSRSWREIHSAYTLCAVLPPKEGVSEGTVRYRRWTYDVSPGQVLLMEPGEVHVTKHLRGSANFRLLQVNPRDFVRLVGGDSNADPPHFASPFLRDPALFSTLCKFHARFSPQTNSDVAEAAVSAILQKALPLNPRIPPEVRLNSTLREEIRHTSQRLRECRNQRITLQTLADDVGLTRFRLNQVFSQELGLPPMQYLLEWRLQHARKCLAHGASVSDAAHDSGFYDQSQFCHAFKRASGLTPSGYRHSLGLTRNHEAPPHNDDEIEPGLA